MSEYNESNKEVPTNAVLHAPEFLQLIAAEYQDLFVDFVNQKLIYLLLRQHNGKADYLYTSLIYDDGYLCWNIALTKHQLIVQNPDTRVAWQAMRNMLDDLYIEVDLPAYAADQLNTVSEALDSTSSEYLNHINHEVIAKRLEESLKNASEDGMGHIQYLIDRQRDAAANALSLAYTLPDGSLSPSLVQQLSMEPSKPLRYERAIFPSREAKSFRLANAEVPVAVKEYYNAHYGVDITDTQQLSRYRVLCIATETYLQLDGVQKWYDFIGGAPIVEIVIPSTYRKY